MIAVSADAGYLAASCDQNPQPGRAAESDKFGDHGQNAGSDADSSSRLLRLYQQKEVLSEEVEKICTHILKDQADITKFQLLAAKYMGAAEQRAKLLSELKEKERSSHERILEIKDEIKRLEA
ncbi:hypothetical protein LTR09_012428 [Extremus antarcticus]|uniref:Uncharacterized protein n=1 Tax=Extremus antarcticus TaxID=702011 RepID=A0AAJ0D9X4_9PEZI|nr:hypothetical protein LTR09_012428 [Extremus antarcticus]